MKSENCNRIVKINGEHHNLAESPSLRVYINDNWSWVRAIHIDMKSTYKYICNKTLYFH
jgi:hypothetical protein